MQHISTPQPLGDGWLQSTILPGDQLVWQFSPSAGDRIRNECMMWGDTALILSNRVAAVRALGKTCGNNIYVGVSGGVDSQAACLLLMKAEIPFTAAIMVFNDGLNDNDVSTALNFCKVYNINYITIDLNILEFLKTDLPKFVEKYECPSPQLTAHLWLCDELRLKFNASTVIFGGNTPRLTSNLIWEFNSTRSQSAWRTYCQINNFNLIGNFLSYSLDIALPLMLFTQRHGAISNGDDEYYDSKVRGMVTTGLEIIPQPCKQTGFESVKAYFQNINGDHLMFEKAFRYRYTMTMPEYMSVFHITAEFHNILINALHKYQ